MKLPKFESEEEEAAFWETHSLVDYLDELEEIELKWEPDEDTCPRCGSPMEAEWADLEVEEALLIKRLKRYKCSVCGAVKLSDEALAKINKLDLWIKRYGLAGILLQKELLAQELKPSDDEETAQAEKRESKG